MRGTAASRLTIKNSRPGASGADSEIPDDFYEFGSRGHIVKGNDDGVARRTLYACR
jgi:hypothetical protein